MTRKRSFVFRLTEEQFGQLLMLFGEGCDNLSQSYASYQKALNMELQRLSDIGVEVYEVEVKVKDFLFWCNENGREVNRDAWNAFRRQRAKLLDAHADIDSGGDVWP